MRLTAFGFIAVALVVVAAARADDDDAKTWEKTHAIVTTRTPIMLRGPNGEEAEIGIPVFNVYFAKGNYVLVLSATGNSGWVEKSKLVVQSDAVELFTERIKSDVDNGDNCFRRAMAHLTNENYRAAMSDFDEAIHRDPKEASYFIGRSLTWVAQEDFDKAITDATDAIRLDAKCAFARFALGFVHQRRKAFKEALAAYTDAIQMMPTFFRAREARAVIWQEIGERDKAVEEYTILINSSAPSSGRYRLGRATLRSDMNDRAGALDDFDAAVESDVESDHPVACRGWFFYEHKEYTKAIKDFVKAVHINPRNSIALNNYAWILATCPDDKLRDGTKAVELSKTACELSDWRDPMHLGTHASAHAEVGQFDEAVRWQEKALALVPEAQKKDFQACLDLYRSHKPKRD
jgi:tetratricopeptide (TPR) repeat protein